MINLTEGQKKLKQDEVAEIDRKWKEEKSKRDKDSVIEKYKSYIGRIPARFRDVKKEDIPSGLIEKFKDKGGLYIWGSCGVGKTHIAYAIKKLNLDKNLEEALKKIEQG